MVKKSVLIDRAGTVLAQGSFEWENQYESSDKGITFNESRDLVFPIPLYEITMSNGTIEQNPGWN